MKFLLFVFPVFLSLAGCIPDPDPAATAYGVEVANYDGEAQLWLTDANSGDRQQLLAAGAQYYDGKFTEDQLYLIVTRKSMSHTQGVIVFKRGDLGGYAELDLKPAIGDLWDQFNSKHEFELEIKYSERVEGYSPESETLRIVIGVFGAVKQGDEVDWHEKEYRLSLARIQ
ncbi:MAG: hypothetical protein ACI8UO_003295 [Verrucomicrobiales bacterium]|jgi:hypothetical protein